MCALILKYTNVLPHFAEDPEERPVNRTIGGQVKLSIHYKNDTLTIMIMHVKSLVCYQYYNRDTIFLHTVGTFVAYDVFSTV